MGLFDILEQLFCNVFRITHLPYPDTMFYILHNFTNKETPLVLNGNSEPKQPEISQLHRYPILI